MPGGCRPNHDRVQSIGILESADAACFVLRYGRHQEEPTCSQENLVSDGTT